MMATQLARAAVVAAGGELGTAITMLENAREKVKAGAFE